MQSMEKIKSQTKKEVTSKAKEIKSAEISSLAYCESTHLLWKELRRWAAFFNPKFN